MPSPWSLGWWTHTLTSHKLTMKGSTTTVYPGFNVWMRTPSAFCKWNLGSSLAKLQHPENVKRIAIASCVLHNLLLDRDPLPKHLVDHEDAEHNLVQGDWRETAIGFERKVPRGGHNVSRDAKNIRDYLAHYYTSEAGAIPWQERVVGEGCQWLLFIVM